MQLCGSLSILWHCLSLGLELKLKFSSPVATAVFQICWHIECSTFTASSFRIWNSSTGIPSPPLALFIVMLPKAHLTLHSRMSGSRWVIIPSWLSGSWRSFLYSSSAYSCYLFLISSASVRPINSAIPVHFGSWIPKMLVFPLAISFLTFPICLDSWTWHSRFLCHIVLYSIGLYFHHQSHPQLGVVFALALSLNSFWSYFSSYLQ